MENKKSFILYCDLIHTVEHLTDEQAGNLFKHILEYVNDREPITDNVITKLSFEPIKQQLKRDLKKWENKTDQRSEAGLSSALSKFRTKLDLSTKLETEKIKKDIESRLSKDKENEYLQQALIICNEFSTKSTTVESRSTKSTDNVNVTVTVNDTVNDISSIKEQINLDKKDKFNEWLNYRTEIKKPIKSKSTLTTLINRFNKEPLEIVDSVVNNSIENGYQGLFWDNVKKENKSISKYS